MQKNLILIGLLVVALLSGCAKKKNSESIPVIPVRTIIADLEKYRNKYEYVGIVEEERSSAMSFTVSGTVKMMYAEEGQRVSKGELLAQLDTANLSNAYNAAKAQLSQAEDAMRRIQKLYDNQSVPEIKYIDIQTQLEKARSVEAIAKKNLSDSRLTAPFSGIIGKKSAESGENVLPGQPIYTLLKIEDVKIKVSVPEKEIADILKNQRTQIEVPALRDVSYEGMIEERGVVADPISHSYTVRVRVHNPASELLPGMVCNVEIDQMPDNSKKYIVLPPKCIQRNGDEIFVWLAVDGVPVHKNIRTGRMLPAGVEIISGLEGGEEVVIDGYQHINEGVMLKKLD